MSSSPLTISVITPCLNPGPFLGKALSSVFSQEGDFSIQQIVMDGGSSDGSRDTLKAFENSLNNGSAPPGCRGIEMEWAGERDRGQSDALNRALRLVRGDVVCWLNADDWFAPGAFQAVADAFLGRDAVDVVIGDCIQMDNRDVPLEGVPVRSFVKDAAAVSPFTWGEQWVLVTPEVFFRRRCLVGFAFDLALDYFMDIDLWLHLFLSGFAFRKIERTLAYFRSHPDCKTIKAWKNFSPRLLLEDQILCSRYREKLPVRESRESFIKLVGHFLTNWERLGVLEDNDRELRRLLSSSGALDREDKRAFMDIYNAGAEKFRRGRAGRENR